MEPTPKERRRIYEEEKARIESGQAQPPPRAAQTQGSHVLIGIVALIITGYFAYSIYTKINKTDSNTPSHTASPTSSQPTSTSGSSSSQSSTTAYDPINDQSEEGIRQNILAADKTITYEQLKKNAERYDGEPWTFTGRVYQIQETGGQTLALVSLDAWGSKLIAVKANFTTDFVEKDQVYVVEYITGNYSYMSIAGWNMTVPAMDARAILKPTEAARIKAGKTLSK